jgi:hypothetical protein
MSTHYVETVTEADDDPSQVVMMLVHESMKFHEQIVSVLSVSTRL